MAVSKIVLNIANLSWKPSHNPLGSYCFKREKGKKYVTRFSMFVLDPTARVLAQTRYKTAVLLRHGQGNVPPEL